MGNNYKNDDEIVKLRTFLHKKCTWIFEHKFDEDKAKKRRNTGVFQAFLTQYSANSAEKTSAEACEERF